MAIIPMPFTAIISRLSALTCAKDASSPRQIPTARKASVWWTKIWPGVTGLTAARSAKGSRSATKKNDAQLFRVVGVVGAVKQAALTEAQGQGAVYLPYASDRDEHASIFVVTRTNQRPEAFAETLRKLVHAAHPLLAVDNIRSMDARIADSLITRRSPALLAGIFAGVALLLAAIGTYGVLELRGRAKDA